MRQRGRGDDGRVGDVDAVMHFVAFLQAAQDGDGVFHGGFIDQHFLEAPLQRGILLDVLAIFVQRGRADAMQFAARQRRLEHIAGVHGALGLAGADHGVQFVDEQDDLAFLLGQIIEHRLETFFEFAAEFGAGDQRAHVQRQQAFALESFRHFAVDDALRQAFDDGGLAHAGLADQHRVVLGAALQYLDGATDLVVAADHRVELALLGALGQIDGVFFQRLALLLGIRVVDLLAAAHLVDGLFDHALGGAVLAQHLAERALVLQGREHEQFAGDVLILALLGEFVGDIEDAVQIIGDVHIALRALDFGQPVQGFAELRTQFVHVHIGLRQQVAHRAALLIEQRDHDVLRLDELVIAADGERLRVGQGLLEFTGQFVHTHERTPFDLDVGVAWVERSETREALCREKPRVSLRSTQATFITIVH